jgi:hypothetical protein
MELETAVKYLVIIVAAAVAMLFGDYLGYKTKRTRLAVILACIILITIIAFTIYAAVYAVTHA